MREPLEIVVYVVCPRCAGRGLILPNTPAEQDCPRCEARGGEHLKVQLGDAAVAAIIERGAQMYREVADSEEAEEESELTRTVRGWVEEARRESAAYDGDGDAPFTDEDE